MRRQRRSIETRGVVSGFDLTQIISKTLTTAVSELPDSTTPNAAFRSDPAGQQWIFNTATGAGTHLNSKGVTYFFNIVLIDGTIIGSSGTNSGELSHGNFSSQVDVQRTTRGVESAKSRPEARLSSIAGEPRANRQSFGACGSTRDSSGC